MEQKKIAFTVNEASDYTNIGRNLLRKLITWNMFPVIRIGKKILIRVEVLDKFLELNEGKDLKNRHELIAI